MLSKQTVSARGLMIFSSILTVTLMISLPILARRSIPSGGHFAYIPGDHRTYTRPPSSNVGSIFSHLFHTQNTCEYPIVYNKPPKTASTYFMEIIKDWANRTGRPNFYCSNQPMTTSVVLQECLPLRPGSCSVLNNHIILDKNARQIINERLPNHRLITTTRHPSQRIVSAFLQRRMLVVDKENTKVILERLRQFVDEFEPWVLYNYHTGEARQGSCPLKRSEQYIIYAMAGRYNLVLDAGLKNISNIILKHHGLFTLPDSDDRANERGAYSLQLPADLKAAIRKVSCVEETLHKAFRLRMASLYEQATGKSCIFGRNHCLEDMER